MHVHACVRVCVTHAGIVTVDKSSFTQTMPHNNPGTLVFFTSKAIWCSDTSRPSRPYRPHLIHKCLSQPHSAPQMTARSVHALSHNYATKSPLVTMGHPKLTPKIFPSPWMICPHLIQPSLDRPHLPHHPISHFSTIHPQNRHRQTCARLCIYIW